MYIWLAYICYRPLKISYQSLNVGIWPKIEGFCHLNAKLMVIFLKYLLLAVCESYLYGTMFFQVLMYEKCSGFYYLLYTHSPVMCLINIQ